MSSPARRLFTANVCPACGSKKTMRDGRYCADCKQPLQNVCVSEGQGAHSCGVNDRYCSTCGEPTFFFRAGWLPEYIETKEYEELRNTEKKGTKAQPSWLMIQPDGEICVT